MSERRKFTDWFDRTYVINLPHRKDRLTHIISQFAKAGVAFRAGQVEVFPAVKPESADGFPNLGARGCFMSHLGLLRNAQRDGLKRILVIEDDLELAKVLVEFPDHALARLDDKYWGIAYLGHNLPMPAAKQPTFSVVTDSPDGSHFYAVQGPAIGELIAFLEAVLSRPPGDPKGGPMHYDGALATFRFQHPEVTTVAASEPLGSQGSSRSDITPRPWDRYPVVRELSHLLRSIQRIGK